MDEHETGRRDPELTVPWDPSLSAEVALGDMVFAMAHEESFDSAPQDRQRLLSPLLASVLIHGLAVLALVSLNFEPRSQTVQPEPGVIQLRIRLPAPETDNLIAEMPVAEVEVTVELLAETQADAQPSTSTADSAPAETRVDLPSVQLSPPPSTLEANPQRPSLRLLSPQDLRQTIDAIADRRGASNALIDCTALQRESEFIDCEERENTRDYSLLERNATYEFFTPTGGPEQTRTQRTIGFMVSRADEIEQQLLATDIGDVAVERFLRELGATAADISATGNVQLERLKDQMYSNDATYQQMQRVMNPR